MGFLLLDLDKLFRKASFLYSLTSDTIEKVDRDLNVLLDSSKRLEDMLTLDGVSVVKS